MNDSRDQEWIDTRAQQIFRFLFEDENSQHVVDHVADRVTDIAGLTESGLEEQGVMLDGWTRKHLMQQIRSGAIGNEAIKIQEMILAVCQTIARDEQKQNKPFDTNRLRKEFLARTRNLQVEKLTFISGH